MKENRMIQVRGHTLIYLGYSKIKRKGHELPQNPSKQELQRALFHLIHSRFLINKVTRFAQD